MPGPMRQTLPPQLTYCTNVHPGQSLVEVEDSLRRHAAAVRRALRHQGTFGVGLRLSAEAATALRSEAALSAFSQLLADEQFEVFTLNGFPYGPFHGQGVKERVYLPDWSSPERGAYTLCLVEVLATLLPGTARGSISTVPGAFKPSMTPQHKAAIRHHLVEVCAELVTLKQERGKHITLCVEPEPHCMLETTEETLDFFEHYLLNEESRAQLCRAAGCAPEQAEPHLRQHLGVCLDACHAAVEFEDPLTCYRLYEARGIAVAKVQVSAGLKLDPRDPEQLHALSEYDEPTYLHQVVQQNGGALTRYLDLPDAFSAAKHQHFADDAEWRVHFHVPVFSADCGVFGSTQAELVPLLSQLRASQDFPHLEIETYTWNVLPAHLRGLAIEQAIAEEIRWTAGHLAG